MTGASEPEFDAEDVDIAAASQHVRKEITRFVRALRRAGANVPANAGTTAARALVEVGFGDRERAKISLRACLITEHADRSSFEHLFPEFWRRLRAGFGSDGPGERFENGPDSEFSPPEATVPSERIEREDTESDENGDNEACTDDQEAQASFSRAANSETATPDEDDSDDETVTTARYSPTGQRTAVSGSRVASSEFDEFERAFGGLTHALAELSGRRWNPGESAPDVRRALRKSVGTGGTVVEVPRREREPSAVRACVVVDVSQSVLDVLDRSFLIRFLRRAHAEWREARIFFFDDDLREVTKAFDAASPNAALDALERAETEWGGGTQIGGSLARLHRTVPEAVSRESAVLVLSDGLEMGDVADLESEMAWLSRRAGAVLWCNPLARSTAYEPTARGMAAALPFLDGLFAFAGPEDLAEMARQVEREGVHGRIGYEYDPRRNQSRRKQSRGEYHEPSTGRSHPVTGQEPRS